MMSTKPTLIVAAFVALIIGGIAIPDPTSAYTPIEEFFYDYPVGPRDAQFRVDQQNEVSRQRREEEQAMNFALQQPVKGDERALARTTADDEQDTNSADATDIINALTQLITTMQDDPNTTEGRRNARLIERLTMHAGAPLDQYYGQGIQQKPLPGTGAGTVVAMLTLLGAGLYTVRRSTKASALVGSATF